MATKGPIRFLLVVFSSFLVSACGPNKPEDVVRIPPAQEVAEQTPQKETFSPTRDDVIGQWRSVLANPRYPNTVANRYMRHTFLDDGTLIVENKEDSEKHETWEFVEGAIVVSSSYETSLFTETFEFRDRDKIVKTRFQSVIDGEPTADYDPDDNYIRQGSDSEKNMKNRDIFAAVSGRADFVDPNTLEVGKTYTLSRNTPLMPSFEPDSSSVNGVITQIQESQEIQTGGAILIRERKELGYQIWYKVDAGEHTGWIKSTALFGQDLTRK